MENCSSVFRICDISLDLVTKASQVKGNQSTGVSLFQGKTISYCLPAVGTIV